MVHGFPNMATLEHQLAGNLQLVDTVHQIASLPRVSPPRGFSFPLEAMAVTGKSKSGEAGRKTLIARADARALLLAPIVADIRASGITSWYGIATELNKRGVPTATGRGIWEQGQVRRMMERARRAGVLGRCGRTR
jgi:hypothetical protein